MNTPTNTTIASSGVASPLGAAYAALRATAAEATKPLLAVTHMTLPVVNIYTRLGARENDAERIVTFRLPEWIDMFDLLKNGFALDGNQAAAAISYDREGAAFVGPFETVEPTLTAALNTAQRALVKYLRAQGYDPQFA